MKDSTKRKCRMEKKYIIAFIFLITLFIIFACQEITSSSSGAGSVYIEIVDLTSPNISLISPSIDYSTTSTTINFVYNVSDSNNVSNCSLIINNVIDQTNTTINKSQSQTFVKVFSLGTYSTYINCTDVRGNKGNSRAIVITVTSSLPPDDGGGGGGGGGGATTKKVSMNIIVPPTISLAETGKTEFSITLENNGEVNFDDVSIGGYLLGDSKLISAPVTFNASFIKLLEKGKKETVFITTYIEDPEILLYEVVINVTSKTPVYNTHNKVFINFLVKDETNVVKIIAFTEGLINENTECAELKDMLNDAKEELAAGNLEEAGKKAQAAIESCKRTIEGLEKPQAVTSKEDNTVKYVILAISLAIILGFLFNIYRRIKFRGWKNFFHKNK